MRSLKKFDEFLRQGIVKKGSPDKSRAEFLIKEAKQNYALLLEIIEKIKIRENNANLLIKNCYDIFMGLIRAKMFLIGYKASGTGAHEAEVSYLREIGFCERDVQFADQIRYFRNGILYYGTILDKEYTEKVISFLKEIFPKLVK